MRRPLELTVAICTRNRPAQLRRALVSLVRQSPPPLEILVVDNAPVDGRTLELVEGEFPGVRYLEEPVPGLDFARNRALSAALGDVVAFLDDDVVAAPGWAAALLAPFQDDLKVAAVTGRVVPLALETEAQRRFEANGGFSRGERTLRLPRDLGEPLHGKLFGRSAPLIAWAVSIGGGRSLAVHRWRMLTLGGFDEALDLGPALPGGGDHDALWRLLDAGWTVIYEPAALAAHEHRRELDRAYDQILGQQRALVALLVKSARNARGPRKTEIRAFLAWRLVKPLVRLLNPGDPLPLRVRLRMLVHAWQGLNAYPAARRLVRERRASL
ncbi:MAG: glycosyltransferase family 2 protein, partial [Thermoanaerobaculia bacterium]